MKKKQKERKIVQFLNHLWGGGAERVAINLSKILLNQGYLIDFVLVRAEGRYLSLVPQGCRIIDLKSKRAVTSIPKLVNYLRKEKPYGLISHISHINIVALISKALALGSTKIIVVEHSNLTSAISNSEASRSRLIPYIMRLTYPWAHNVVTVSHGVANDLLENLHLLPSKLRVIYNPIVDEELKEKAQEITQHPWFDRKLIPIILGVGRLTKVKDFPTLIKSFSLVRQRIPAKLVILGEGEDREMLERLIKKLGLEYDVDLPGFIDNPYSFMKRSDVFVLSSLWEGLPTVIVEAMACGCPVVSTDCPSGPAEILEGGEDGILVPIGDFEKMASAIIKILTQIELSSYYSKKGIERAMDFSVEKAAEEYISLFKTN